MQNLYRRIFLVLAMSSLTPVVRIAEAQYFGQNKVQYENFHFDVLKTEHFDVYFYPEEKEAAQQAARLAERWYARHAKLLDHHLHGRQPLMIYASHPQFEQTNAIQGELGEGTGGVTEALKRRIVLPLAGPLAETDHVIGHELVHAFQYDITGQGGGAGFRAPTALNLPLWFIEGMAEYMSLGPIDPNTAMWMRDATKHNKLPAIKKLDDPRFFPYRYGQALLAYIAGRWGDEALGKLLRTAGKSGHLDNALRAVTGMSPDSLSQAWHQAIHAAYDPIAKATRPPSEYGQVLIKADREANDLNIGPVLSPDGKKLVFFSSRNLFSIDLFLADAETGKIKRSIVKTELDPHFQSLEFINSAGAWDAESRRFVFPAIVKARPALDILDMARDKIEREIKFPTLGEIYNPTWSPDGRYIAFSALANGFSDLFIYDLQADSLRRLTNDAFADLQPVWSPDGRSIAFVTDRFSTVMSDLKTGNYRLALMNPVSGEITPLSSFEDAKNIDPQWSNEAASLYFLSDHNGITNIYRLDIGSGTLHQVTNLYTGVSGITDLSPALSVAAHTNRMVFSVYEEGKYNIYAVSSEPVLAGNSLIGPFDDVSPAALPPQNRSGEELLALKADPDFGLPAANKFTETPYHAKLTLDYIGQPFLAAGADQFGTFFGGGASLFWSDLLGDHNLGTMLQVQTDAQFTDVAAAVAYQNTKHRLNWGVVVQQVPYVTGGFNSGYFADSTGALIYAEQDLIYRQINRDVSGVFAYPFNRAQRLEFSAGYSNISFSSEVTTLAVDAYTDSVLVDRTDRLPSPGNLHLAQASAALVYDNSIFGATSPLIGQRYRFEVTPVTGSLNFYTWLADYRRYFMPLRPFTLAARIMHYGRYGRGAEDDRFADLFIGYPELVRGYDLGSFTASEVGPDSANNVFNRLQGSKLLVANFELRFPLFRVLGLGQGFYGALPIEMAAFYDAGVAWTHDDKASFLGGDRKPVSSFGAGLRVNLLGFAIGEVDLVHPNDRPQKGWYFEFSLTPGF